MNVHLSNFLEAMVFADECDIDTSKLREDAPTIVAQFLMANALAVANFESVEEEIDDAGNSIIHGEGSAAFHLGIVATIGDDLGAFDRWPSLRECAAKLKEQYPC